MEEGEEDGEELTRRKAVNGLDQEPDANDGRARNDRETNSSGILTQRKLIADRARSAEASDTAEKLDGCLEPTQNAVALVRLPLCVELANDRKISN